MVDSVLQGEHVRLEPLGERHVDGLMRAAEADPGLYQWSPVPQGRAQAARYVETALAWKAAGTAAPFAILRADGSDVLGASRLFNLERWSWPAGHPRHGRENPDAGEIGYSWLTRSAVRTPVNTEAKFPLLKHAFEEWGALRVCFHADARNERSRAAIKRIGGKSEGVLRAHRMAVDHIARDSHRFSILASEWPEAKARLRKLLAPRGSE